LCSGWKEKLPETPPSTKLSLLLGSRLMRFDTPLFRGDGNVFTNWERHGCLKLKVKLSCHGSATFLSGLEMHLPE
jgi:hypothetical protein